MLVSAIPDGKLPTWDDPFGGTDDEHMFEAGMAMSRDNYRSALQSGAILVITSKAMPTRTITSFKSCGSIGLFANSLNSISRGLIGKPSPIETKVKSTGPG